MSQRMFGAMLLAAVLTSCGGSGVTDGSPPTSPTQTTIARILLSRDTATVLTGASLAVTATPLDAAGRVVADRSITWASTAPTVVGVSATLVSTSATITALGVGSASITASSEGVSSASMQVVVIKPPPVVTSVLIAPGSPTMSVAMTTQLTATATDSEGAPVLGRGVAWVSRNATVVTVSATGLATALATGTATIVGTVDGRSDSTTISVIIAAKFTEITTGGASTCALDAAGQSFCWGLGGNPMWTATATDYCRTSRCSMTPKQTPVSGLADIQLARSGSTDSPVCVLPQGGLPECWSYGTSDVQGVPQSGTFTSVATGERTACGLDWSNHVWCWGSNQYGAVGHDTAGSRFVRADTVNGGHAFVSLSVGWAHACALTSDGAAYCWGANFFNQLGAATPPSPLTVCSGYACSTVPVRVATSLRFVAISAGGSHTCALTADGDAYCWGLNATGQLGDGTTTDRATPTLVSGGLVFASISAGGHGATSSTPPAGTTCGVTTNGRGYCWGASASGGLGAGALSTECDGAAGVYSCSKVPIAVAGGLSFASIVTGTDQFCGITVGSLAFCWGLNYAGQLGDGTTANRNTPTPVRTP